MATAGDTAFGVTRYCEHAIWDDLPKIAFCTQEYNLFTQNKVEFGEYFTMCKGSALFALYRSFIPHILGATRSLSQPAPTKGEGLGPTTYVAEVRCFDIVKVLIARRFTYHVACSVLADLVEACAPKQENVAIVATQTLGGGVFSGKYLFERNKWDRVRSVLMVFLFFLFEFAFFCVQTTGVAFVSGASQRMSTLDLPPATLVPPGPAYQMTCWSWIAIVIG